jgi:hypothetical protein
VITRQTETAVDDAFLDEIYTVQRLAVLTGDSDGAPLVREYLVRRAAVADRLAEGDITDAAGVADFVHDAVHYARALLGHDMMEGATLGPIPATAPCWSDDPRGYARQEHRAWILASLPLDGLA